MKKPTIPLRLALAVTLCLTLVASSLRSLAFFTAFDRSVGYFNDGILSTLLYIVIALALIGLVVFALAHRRAPRVLRCPTRDDRSPLLVIGAVLTGIVLAAATAGEVLGYINGAGTTSLIRALAAALAIPYFLLPSSKRVLPCGLAAHLYGLLLLISGYFDRYVPMNSPLKVMQQFALVAFMLYLASEMYAAMGTIRPVRTAVLGLLSVFLCVTNGVSCIATAVAGDVIPKDYWIGAVVVLAFGLNTAARLYTATTRPLSDETEVN